jgi:transglutaminase-like putative cysteine protease
MAKRIRWWFVSVGVLALVGLGAASPAQPSGDDSTNLLVNPSVEEGHGDRPFGWQPIELPAGQGQVQFAWDAQRSHDGTRSLRIEATGTKRGIWSQEVPIEQGVVYELSGYVAFERLERDADCHLQVVFRGEKNELLEFVDLARHYGGSREFELDFPARMLFRAPAGATRVEVNGYLSGAGTAWFDSLVFREAPVGVLAGRVATDGEPVAGARVYLWGDPWGETIEAVTDANGVYRLADVPVSHPRFIVIVGKDGYRTKPQGGVVVVENGITTVDFDLESGTDPSDDLEVGHGFLCLSDDQAPIELPASALLPDDPTGYISEVRPYLEPDEIVTSDDPAIVQLADEILASLSADDRRNAVAVARAVYEWISVSINHDAVYGNRQPYLDVTSGIWQTIQPGGWCWGKNFYDWGYRPAELLEEQVGICVEHSWLGAALLRALNIPARARVGSAQFWVQNEGGNGAWYGFSTNGGSNTYRETGYLGAGFGDSVLPTFYSVTSTPFLAEDWDWAEPGIWRELHPWGETYTADEAGFARAKGDLDHYALTGEAARGTAKRRPGVDLYEINYSQITLSRWSLANQSVIDVRFPMPTESSATTDTGEWAYWTNHPECVIDTYVETIDNPPVPEVQRWRHIVFDVSVLLGD